MQEPVRLRVAPGFLRRLLASVKLANSTELAEVIVVGDGSELTPAEVGEEFGVSPATVRRWGERGWLAPTRKLPGSGYRRYSRTDVDAFRERLEAGEYDGVVEVAANRPKPAPEQPAKAAKSTPAQRGAKKATKPGRRKVDS